MLLLKDTDQHPDVIAQRKLIESLKSRAASAAPADTGRQGRGEPAMRPTTGASGRCPTRFTTS